MASMERSGHSMRKAKKFPDQMLDFLFQMEQDVKGVRPMDKRKYGIVGSAWVLHAFDMDSLVGIVNSFLSNFGVCCV